MIRQMLLPLLLGVVIPAIPAMAQAESSAQPTIAETFAAQDAAFAKWMADAHVPGLVWGVVINGRLVHVKAMGVQDLGDAKRPVTIDTGFRIASMSKAFTGYAILKLRDEGKLRLDDPAWKHVPELKSWAKDITVADLLYHNGGFVTDDPWGDRQQPMSEADFTKFIKSYVPQNTSRGVRFEYSNFGYALLGRIISNRSKRNFSNYVGDTVFQPLGMKATTYEVDDVPREKLAIGYRWENDAWAEEPSMAHGAFGSMGGVVTTANDYAKWIAFLLTGFEEPAGQVVAKPVIRAMQTGGGFPQARTRPGTSAPDCRLAAVYAKGLISGNDCVLGSVLFHGGGFPGYGSHMLLIPETGSGVFALTNRTYAGPSGPVWDAATALFKAGHIAPRPSTISPTLDNAYGVAKTIWQDGGLANISQSALAMNFLMDRSAENWAKRIAELKAQSGACDTSKAVDASGALSGSFEWQCEKGIIRGALLLAPTSSPQIQSLNFSFRKAGN